MKISLGCDHGGYALKQELMAHLKEKGVEFEDIGTYSEASCNYPEYAERAARGVAEGKYEKGILVCGTGIGMSLAANKIPGIRCALLSDVMSARLTREHNDTNMMALGAAVTGEMLALEIVDVWLDTEFSHAERHQRRIDKVMAYEHD